MSIDWGRDDDDSLFAQLLGSLVSDDEDVAVLINSYFDESCGDDGLLCVAGYTFTAKSARELCAEWRKMLVRYKLPYFRMSACNSRKHPFGSLSEQQCIDVSSEAIGLIHKHAYVGYAATVNTNSFEAIVTDKGFVATAYELCVWTMLAATMREVSKGYPNSKCAYFFESGFKHQAGANDLMNIIFQNPSMKESYRYLSHSFVDKAACLPAQCADLLSWQWYKDCSRRSKGSTSPRGDLKALLDGTRHHVIDFPESGLQRLVDTINERSGSPIGNEIAGLARRNPKSPVFPKRPGETGSEEAYQEFLKQFPGKAG